MKSELGVTFVSIVLTTLICLAFQLLTFSDKFGPQTQISSNLLGKNTFQSQINLKDTDFSRENCTNLLHDGFWRKPGAGEQINSYSFNGNRSMVWEPGKSVNCDWVVYTWPKMAQCFESVSKTFNTSGSDRSILRVIGDSRGRQYRQLNEQAVFGFLLTFGAFEHENQVTSFAPLAVKKSTVFIFQRFTLY